MSQEWVYVKLVRVVITSNGIDLMNFEPGEIEQPKKIGLILTQQNFRQNVLGWPKNALKSLTKHLPKLKTERTGNFNLNF